MHHHSARQTFALALFGAGCLAPLSPHAQQVQPLCTDNSRACLVATATTYIEALTRHDAVTVPFAPDVRRTEQNRESATSEHFIRQHTITQPDMEGHVGDRFFVDLDTRNVVVFTRLRVPGKANPRRPPAPAPPPTTVHLAERFKVEHGLIREIEAIFVRQEGTMDGPTNWPATPSPAPVRPGRVAPSCTDTSRACLIAAARSYFDGIVAQNSSHVPFAANVRRTLGGSIVEGEDQLRHFLDHEEPPMAFHRSRYFVDRDQDTVVVYTTILITGDRKGGAQQITSRVADRIRVAQGYIVEIEGMVFGETDSSAPYWAKPMWPD